ncbi:WhiB family transcriptional regulator [Streptomyces sp. NBC_00687]|uniref:WhiB family transcriptional regulator n=1 Tax=Streptomyces sp. NBC_00687 TaxID=2975807 RepID=UPI00224F8638|nr:WhiB family transcriptional regulator [Streptomyces sp. NBC_00687]MCX4919918.1 WhiB family transcriptional regulator [Streptomyces sp. NBC_00687]
MSRPAKAPGRTGADPRIPFPRTDAPLACREEPHLFLHEYGQSSEADLDRIALAKQACGGCPIAVGCLKWALANGDLTPTNIWAATTARDRSRLRKRLQHRHGPDWIAALTRPDREHSRQRPGSRTPAPGPPRTPSTSDSHHSEPAPAADQPHRDVLPLGRRTPHTHTTLAEAS